MRAFARWVSVAIVGFVIAACGGGGSGGQATPSNAQLQARLLNVGDVGASWKAGNSINDQDLAAFAQSPCDSATIDPAVVKRLTAVTGAQFEPVDQSYHHLIELVVRGDAKQLNDDMRGVFTAFESCASTGSTGKSALTVKKLAIPKLGDQQAAWAMTQKPQGGATNALLLRAGYVRLGSVAVLIGLADFQASADGTSQISDDTFRGILTKATTKLGGTT